MRHPDYLFNPVLPDMLPVAGNSQSQPSWRFIDTQTYAALKETRHALDPQKFKELWYPDSSSAKRISASTHTYITFVDELVKQVLFNTLSYASQSKKSLDHTYLEMQAKAYLKDKAEPNTLFYEFMPIDSENFMVVVGRGFLYHVTQSKDNLQRFVLACLGCIDHFNCTDLQLNTLYLRLNFIQDYTVLLQAKAQL